MSIFHVYSSYDPEDVATQQRQAVARMTWSTQLWTSIPVRDEELPRVWDEEGRKLPYIHDLFEFSCRGDSGDSVVVFTNSDICVCSNCSLRVAAIMQDVDAFYAYRRDFNHDFTEPIPDDVIPRGINYAGSDFYAFRVKWWINNRKEFPDFLLGTEGWDPVFRHLMEFSQPGKKMNIPNICYHRRHETVWENSKNRYRLKCQLHNLQLASRWLIGHGINPEVHGILVKHA